MFDLSIPIICDRNNGEYATIMWSGDDGEECLISLVEGFGITDLMEYWLREGFALVIDKTRKRGFLPMGIGYDEDGRIGCAQGYGVFLNNGKVHIIDERVFRKTCACDPLDWWKCVDYRAIKDPTVTRCIVPEKDFLAWVNRLESLMHVRDCMIDSWSDSCEIMRKNSKIFGRVLNGVAGGRDFLSVLPIDWMERDRAIHRSGPHFMGKRVELSEYPGATADFDEECAPHRDNGELAWWIKRAFLRDNIVVFLCPRGKTKSGVPVSIVRPSDNIDEILPEILEKTCTGSEAVDHVAFSARCDLEELRGGGNHAVLTRGNFRKLLKGASRVLLGTCKGTSWDEFPLGEIVRKPFPPLFENETKRYNRY
jgi:hypothetical protein